MCNKLNAVSAKNIEAGIQQRWSKTVWVERKSEMVKRCMMSRIEINWSVLSGGVVCFLNIYIVENVERFLVCLLNIY